MKISSICFQGGLPGVRAKPVLVIESGGPAPEHLQARDLRGPVDEVCVQPGFQLPDVPEPVVKGQVFVDAAQEDHGRMRVHVKKARDDSFSAAVLHLRAGGYGDGLPADAHDLAAIYENIGGMFLKPDVPEENHLECILLTFLFFPGRVGADGGIVQEVVHDDEIDKDRIEAA